MTAPIIRHRQSSLTPDPLSPSLVPHCRSSSLTAGAASLSLSQTMLTVVRSSPPLLPRRRSSLTADFKGFGGFSAELLCQQSPEGEKICLNSDLWHACAGPLVSLPAVGSRVVYFPQGHSEQVGWDESTAGERQPRVSLWEIEPLTTFPIVKYVFHYEW
ncbi:Auxin response factor 8 [Camellia lanceoleosa]|uniref:Auxin response factor 8 n=1 Tax=Camellia lanceoleosa TaxID=1840588 RepID=A0ACC0HIZ2_9ERIC|nr:Auxin response factor 8 [Camellia lanceoleosa]